MRSKTWVATARKGGTTITAEIVATERPSEMSFALLLLIEAEHLDGVPLTRQPRGNTDLEKLHNHGFSIESIMSIDG